MGPRTLQSLALVSEVVHGTPARFSDPARFAFAHGGKSARPFPVPTKVYDETIGTLKTAAQRAKMGQTDRTKALAKLTQLAQRAEGGCVPYADKFHQLLDKEKRDSWKYGGRTVKGFVKPPNTEKDPPKGGQLSLFD